MGEISYGIIMGIVRDSKTKKPLENFRVYIKGTDLFSLTDSSGRYKIENIPLYNTERKCTIVVSREGYLIMEKEVSLNDNETTVMDIEVFFPLWQRTYGGDGDDVAQSIQQTTDGGYIVAGSTNSFGAGGYDIYLLKLDKDGNTGPLIKD